MIPEGIAHKLYWATATGHAGRQNRTVQNHAGSRVCHHGIKNLNHLGVPAINSSSVPELLSNQNAVLVNICREDYRQLSLVNSKVKEP